MRRYGEAGGKPRKLAVGEAVSRAQSNGEWPGERSTFLRGFVGMELCVGGKARDEDEKVEPVGVRLGCGERIGGEINPDEG